MRVQFNSDKSLILWVIVFFALAGIVVNLPPDENITPIILWIIWIYTGSGICDLIVLKDWDELKIYLIKLVILISLITIGGIYWK